MTTINKLSTIDAIANDDLIPLWDSSSGDTRKVSASTLLKGSQGLTVVDLVSMLGTTTLTVANATNDILVSVSGGSTSQIDIMLPSAPFDGQRVTLTARDQLTIISNVKAIAPIGFLLSDTIRPFTGSYISITWRYSLAKLRWYVSAIVPGIVMA